MKITGHHIPFCGQKLSQHVFYQCLSYRGQEKYLSLLHGLFLIPQVKLCFFTQIHSSAPGSISLSLNVIKTRVPDLKEGSSGWLQGQEKVESQPKWYCCHYGSTNLIWNSTNPTINGEGEEEGTLP